MKFKRGDLVKARWYNLNSGSFETGAAIFLEQTGSVIMVWAVALQKKRVIHVDDVIITTRYETRG